MRTKALRRPLLFFTLVLAAAFPPAASHAAEGTSAAADIRASREYREHLARVLVSRALTRARRRRGADTSCLMTRAQSAGSWPSTRTPE